MASITSVAPTTQTLPTHDLVAGAALAARCSAITVSRDLRESKGFDARGGINSLTFVPGRQLGTDFAPPRPAPRAYSSWFGSEVGAAGATGRSPAPVRPAAIASTTS